MQELPNNSILENKATISSSQNLTDSEFVTFSSKKPGSIHHLICLGTRW